MLKQIVNLEITENESLFVFSMPVRKNCIKKVI